MEPSASLAGQVFCLSGTFSSPKAALEARIKQLGGDVAKSLTKKVTALLVADPANPTAKLLEAQARGVHLLGEGFLGQCEALAAAPPAAGKKGKGKKAEAKAAKPAAAVAEEKPAAKATAKGKGASKKKQPEPEPEPEEEEEQPPAEEKPAAKGKGKGKKAAAAPGPAPAPAPAPAAAEAKSKAKAPAKGKGKKAVVVEEPDDDEQEDDEPAPAAPAGSSGTTLDSAGFFGSAPKVQAWKNDASGQPYFPSQYNVLKNVVLQNTNILNNNNKYYALELHEAEGKYFRLFTHYGRTDDLQSRGPAAGQRETRYYSSLAHAQAAFGQIYREKTSAKKGYREVSLASSDIGSDRARGKSAGEIGASTLAKTKRPAEEEEEKKQEAATTKKERANKRSKKSEQSAAESKQQQEDDIVLDVHVRDLIKYIYDEAKLKLTSSIQAEVTADGIRTPLGILSIEQVEQGESILDRIQKEVMRPSPRSNVLQQLSSEFYSTIPHRLGRTKAELQAAVIREQGVVKEKQELLQLMKDMLEVNSNAKTNVIFHDDTVNRYRALQAEITWLSPETEEYQKVAARVVESVSQSHKRQVVIQNVFKVVRPNEQERFRHDIGNVQLLFHGSRLSNWVGLLSRGILMPKVVVAEGGRRTDAGWLGNGIYFGHADVANNYAAPGRKGTSLMFCNSVAIGRTKDFSAITYGMNAPPKGFDSCHGVMGTQFADHEYCVYDDAQQKVEYLLEVNRASYGYF